MALVYQGGYHGAEWQQKLTEEFFALSVDYEIIISATEVF